MDASVPAPETAATSGRPDAADLPGIPLIDLGAAGPVALIEAERARAEALCAGARRQYGRLFLRWGDRLSRRWLARANNPYLGEIDETAARIGLPGTHLLNLSYEWFCTSSVCADPARPGNRMLRTIDWPLEGLGRHVVVARSHGPAGPYFNVTWPGFVGVATAMAPGRFSAAFNQAPMRRGKFGTTGLPPRLDWLRNRLGVWRSRGLPPAHVLRQVFDGCRTYAEAKTRLCEAPLCLPAFFILSGVGAHEGCVIERLETRAVVHAAPACVTNHWLTPGLGNGVRGFESCQRLAVMETRYRGVSDGFSWLTPPIVNACTRLAATANASACRLEVQGFEADSPATAVLRL